MATNDDATGATPDPHATAGSIQLAQPTGNNLVSITQHGLGDLKVYSVYFFELDQIGSLTSREQISLGFLGISLGAFLSVLLAVLTSPPKSSVLEAFFWFVVAGAGVASAFLFFQWRNAAKERDDLLVKIRSRPPLTQLRIN